MIQMKPRSTPPAYSNAAAERPVNFPSRGRTRFLFAAILLFFSAIGIRLFSLQIVGSDDLESLAQKQFQKAGKTAPYRASLLDRNGEELAVSLSASSIFARPRLIRNKRKTAAALSKTLGGSYEKWITRIDTAKSFVWIQRQVEPEVAHKISRLNLPGLFIESENRRVYPNGRLASNLIGFTDIDGNGLTGLELGLNSTLVEKGHAYSVVPDGKGNPSYIEKPKENAGPKAPPIRLTIERHLQHVVEEELEQTLKETGGKFAYAIVMDPKNGEILAWGQAPTFDPNHANESPLETHPLRSFSTAYEPGSILKPIFVAEALQQGKLDPATLIDCGQGSIKVGRETIREAESHEKFGFISLEKILTVSSNVGAVRVGQTLGPELVRQGLDRFGLTTKINLPLPGEAISHIRWDDYLKNPVHLATVSFGQGAAFNLTSVVAAYAPFANGGFKVSPHVTPPATPQEPQRILSPRVAEKLRAYLTSAVESKEGTGKGAAIPGIRVAGKTGTAQKYTAGVGYGGKNYLSSFVGFLPADSPELIIGISVDEPKGKFYAADVAVPTFRRLGQKALQILNRIPKQPFVPSNELVLAPQVAEQKSAPKKDEKGRLLMPELRGTSLREAIEQLGGTSVPIRIKGTGYVQQQKPQAGTPLQSQSSIELAFSPAG